MELERHQIELRYAALRIAHEAREARLAASLLAEGQHHPVLVFRDQERFVLVDGYRRVRALTALGKDLVRALDLECGEDEALVRAWKMGTSRRPEAVEEGWLLQTLRDTCGMSQRDLSLRTGRTVSWVSRRLALVSALPSSVQLHLQRGTLQAHAAQKVLVPLARANRAWCETVAETVARERWSSRQVAQWWSAFRAGNATVRERLVREPSLYLRTVAATERRLSLPPETPEGRACALLGSVASACWKGRTQLGHLLDEHPEVSAHEGVVAAVRQVRSGYESLTRALEAIDAVR